MPSRPCFSGNPKLGIRPREPSKGPADKETISIWNSFFLIKFDAAAAPPVPKLLSPSQRVQKPKGDNLVKVSHFPLLLLLCLSPKCVWVEPVHREG